MNHTLFSSTFYLMTQTFRALTALSKTLVQIEEPTHWLLTTFYFSSKRFGTLFWPLHTPGTHIVHIHIYILIYIWVKKVLIMIYNLFLRWDIKIVKDKCPIKVKIKGVSYSTIKNTMKSTFSLTQSLSKKSVQ